MVNVLIFSIFFSVSSDTTQIEDKNVLLCELLLEVTKKPGTEIFINDSLIGKEEFNGYLVRIDSMINYEGETDPEASLMIGIESCICSNLKSGYLIKKNGFIRELTLFFASTDERGKALNDDKVVIILK